MASHATHGTTSSTNDCSHGTGEATYVAMPKHPTSATSDLSRPMAPPRTRPRTTPAIDRSARATAPSAATALGYQLASNPVSRGHARLIVTTESTSGPSAPRPANAPISAHIGTSAPARNGRRGARAAASPDDRIRDDSATHVAMPSPSGTAF